MKSKQSMFWKSLRKINSKTLFILLLTPKLPTWNHYVSTTVNILARSNQYLSWDTSGRRDLWRHMAHSRKGWHDSNYDEGFSPTWRMIYSLVCQWPLSTIILQLFLLLTYIWGEVLARKEELTVLIVIFVKSF